MFAIPRRRALHLAGATALTSGLGGVSARAAEKIVTIGMSFPLTGSLALQAGIARDAAVYAIDQVNAKGGLGGFTLQSDGAGRRVHHHGSV